MIYEFKMVDKLKEYGLTTVKIFGILEELHKKISRTRCKEDTINLDGFDIFCNKCNKVILSFCPVCGSTKTIDSKFSVSCSNCGVVLDTKFF